ncbi:MAG: hypothetical protein RIQ70_1226 [Bacteroidota bacterium]|jgi:regulator of replication initiation timing
MSQENILNRLDYLEIKIRKLVEAHLVLKESYLTVVEENNVLKNNLASKDESLINFQNQEKMSTIVSSLAEDTPGASELKSKINEVIKEIDKCIAQLSE